MSYGWIGILCPDSSWITRDLEPSVMFVPLDPDDDYPVRVHSAIPCGGGWVWDPERFTGWQRNVVARASEAARRARPAAWSEPRDVQVAESAEHLAIYIWTAADEDSEEPALTMIMRKADLEVIRVDGGSKEEAGARP